jgi:hypothetical protein
MEAASGGGASMCCEFSMIVGSGGVEMVGTGFIWVIIHYMLRRGGEQVRVVEDGRLLWC